ncbi:hypothetical protein [Mailhella massiliensis]|uniref:hypothetical protein n=1 Tax=Mailhella massiliensis TaxID=1903261 RepID=UPI0013903342|nr:hypothetical protein [Mailhella massiliensis]
MKSSDWDDFARPVPERRIISLKRAENTSETGLSPASKIMHPLCLSLFVKKINRYFTVDLELFHQKHDNAARFFLFPSQRQR